MLICATSISKSRANQGYTGYIHAFLSWIPLGYIFESPLLEILLKFFPVPSYRNLTLQCLTEVAALNFGDFYNLQYVKMYTVFIVQLQTVLPTSTNIPLGSFVCHKRNSTDTISLLDTRPSKRAVHESLGKPMQYLPFAKVAARFSWILAQAVC